MILHGILIQIQETAKLHELAAEQGFGVYMLVFFCTVLMYVVVTLWKKNEKLNETLLSSYKDNNRIDEHLAVISQNLNQKNYDALEQQIRALQKSRAAVDTEGGVL